MKTVKSFEKFSKGENIQPFRYPNIYEIQQFEKFARLSIAPSEDQIELILTLIEQIQEPFGILYLLIVPRADENKEGRYQSPNPISKYELKEFIRSFKNYLEMDGRHTIWIQSLGSNNLIVYDKHNIVYAYGDLDKYRKNLETMNFTENKVEIPVPHAHHYHPEFDEDERKIMSYWAWKYFPLQDQDYE